MSIRYSNDSFIKSESPTFFWGGGSFPFSQRREYEPEQRLRHGDEHDPERPPQWKPGDRYTRIGLIVGLIVGGVLGAIVGGRYFFFVGLLLGLAGGAFVGVIIGAVIGGFIRKRRGKTKKGAQKPF
jgi:outer membrane lipoprotein SlyB